MLHALRRCTLALPTTCCSMHATLGNAGIYARGRFAANLNGGGGTAWRAHSCLNQTEVQHGTKSASGCATEFAVPTETPTETPIATVGRRCSRSISRSSPHFARRVPPCHAGGRRCRARTAAPPRLPRSARRGGRALLQQSGSSLGIAGTAGAHNCTCGAATP